MAMVEPEMTDEGLRFIREEILKVMVTSIALAKAETVGAFEISNQGTIRAVAVTNAASNYGSICLACAIVAALGDAGVLDPKNVIKWAEWMAENQPTNEASVSEAASRMLRNFASMIASMTKPRPEGFAARN
jgi:hypothetical protein